MMTGIFRPRGGLRGWYAHPVFLFDGVLTSYASVSTCHYYDDAIYGARHEVS